MINETKVTIVLLVLILICLFKLPYGAYSLIRFILLIGFCYLAFTANEAKQETACIIYIILAVLFQPIFKIPLGRTIWNIVDVVVAIGLIYSLIKQNKKSIN